jgi:TMEM175 potassium channel family protein
MPVDDPESAPPAVPEPAPAPETATEAADETGEQDGTERIVMLSDGVVAIALTLLILGIQVPSPDGVRDPNSISALAGALSHTVDGWISYVISFYVIAQFWQVHRRVFRGIRGHAEGLVWWNFLFLFTITVMPFTADLIGKWADNPLAVIIFSGNLILANVASYGVLAFSRRHHLLTARGDAVAGWYRSLEGVLSLGFYLLAIPVAFVNPSLAKLCWAGLAIAPWLAARITGLRGERPAA